MKTILVPLGNSDKAISTLQYAVDFASVTNAKIYVIQVYSSIGPAYAMKKMDSVLEKDSKEDLAFVLSKVDVKNIEIVSKTIKGQVTDSISRIAKQLNVDLIIASAKNISVDSSVYLGAITGGLVKHTDLPILIIPKGYVYKPIHTILLGLRSGMIKRLNVLSPLQDFVKIFNAKVNLLHVTTPNNTEEDAILNSEFSTIAEHIINSENATVFQGVLEHLKEVNPDMLCVIRRKRGFFSRLWEDNRIKKVDFESRIPLLVLKGNL
ncbi:MAG: universal stress protein [Flavobacteriales bacterium]|nr:universal stress protein [Flavobacteriales bacterium]